MNLNNFDQVESGAYISMTTISNAADWHATMAMKAYRKKQWDVYRRHIKIADNLRS